jgi:GT2 family glycosyltransferase
MISVAIPTYGRDAVLVETITALLSLNPPPPELIVVDQTHQHDEVDRKTASCMG